MTTQHLIIILLIAIWLAGAALCYFGLRWVLFNKSGSRYQLGDRIFIAYVSLLSWITVLFVIGVLIATRGNKNNVLGKEVRW